MSKYICSEVFFQIYIALSNVDVFYVFVFVLKMSGRFQEMKIN